jgi:ribosomal protein S18 acetylase RimI-like enzyme
MDDLVIRPARPDDRDSVVAFTADTFAWGDYVPDAFDDWLGEDGFVVAEFEGRVVGLVRGVLLSPQEAWLQGARVHPAYRRRGVAARLNEHVRGWARDRGAVVARLLIEEDNHAAQAQVEASGMRAVARFVRAHRAVGDASPYPAGNGGRRIGAMEKLRRAHSSEADPAFMAWSTSELARAGRGLFGVAWRVRRIDVSDLVSAAQRDALWVARSGWVMAAVREDLFEVGWMASGPDDAEDLMRAVTDVAVDEGADRVQAMVPATDWVVRAARRANYATEIEIVYAVEL